MKHLCRTALRRIFDKKLWAATVLGLLGISLISYSLVDAMSVTTLRPSILLIDEIKLGGSNTTPSEYVTLYNATDNPIGLAGWTVEYTKPTLDPQLCSFVWYSRQTTSTVVRVPLSGNIAPHQVSSPIAVAMNNNVAGSLHILSANAEVTDAVGWGSDTTPAPCAQTAQAAIPPDGSSLQRYLQCDATTPQNSYDNSQDFVVTNAPAPGLLAGILPESCQHPSDGGAATDPTSAAALPINCQGITLNELLPNPTGTDTGHEFIELHNPLDSTVSLNGCKLQTSSSTTKTFPLDGITLAPGAYLSLYDGQTGLTLPNGSGGTVWLLDPTAEVDSTDYPADMNDDTAWAHVDGQWQATYTPTPNNANILTTSAPCPDGQSRNTGTGRCEIATPPSATGSTPMPGSAACPSGQSRNPATNRCRKDPATVPAACPTGQSRSPDTGRCRKNAAAASGTPAACKAGQERNPATNRCRAITAANATAKACPSGQERNANTNRCRKISATNVSAKSNIDDVKDVASGGSGTIIRWGAAILALTAAAAYGLYEWRQEVMIFLHKKLPFLPLPGPRITGKPVQLINQKQGGIS